MNEDTTPVEDEAEEKKVEDSQIVYDSAFTKRSRNKKTDAQRERMRKHYWYTQYGPEKAMEIIKQQGK